MRVAGRSLKADLLHQGYFVSVDEILVAIVL